MKSKTLSVSLLALASLALVACTSAGAEAPVATGTPGGAMIKHDATPAVGMQKDEGMTRGDTMTMPSATPADGMMKKHDAMGQPPATPSDGMTKPAATPADAMKKDDGMNKPGAMVGSTERYVAYSPETLANASKNGRAVLFFRADWCPTCRVADAEFRANLNKIPADVTVLRVNYDAEAALKQKYAVTYQHTFIQVDASGKQLSRWNGGGLEDLLASLK